METDLKKIKQFGEERDRENWEFRSFLKFVDMEPEELDALVHEVYSDVSSQIDCTKCANCCKEMKPLLSQKDIKNFATGIDVSVEEFTGQHIEKVEDPNEYYFNKKPCPFLKDDLCTNYDFRPEDCRSFPHLDKSEFITRLWSVVENYSICPIVFNVYEILKTKLWQFRDDDLYDDFDEFEDI
jgi:Fe-S-cluster containining protein